MESNVVTPLKDSNPLTRELEEAFASKNVLTCRTRRKLVTELRSAATERDNTEMQNLRRKAIEELITSERTYLDRLELIDTYFAKPSRSLLPQSVYVSIFGDIPNITQVNKELLSALESDALSIGKVFLELSPYLKFYSTYASEFQMIAKTVEEWTDKSKEFKEFLESAESRPEVQLKLNALMITPIQRIPRYKLLLEDVVKTTPEQHPDKTDLNRALAEIESIAKYINEQIREHEMNLKMIDIQRSLVGNVPKLVQPGRKLIKSGVLMKVPRTGGGTGAGGVGSSTGLPRFFVLFSDMLIYCKMTKGRKNVTELPKANSLECGCTMPLKHCRVETVVGKGVFKITCRKEELLCYSDEESSSNWIESIEQTIIKLRKDVATLRKESSKREPMRRPEILKMRRESLSQIMLMRKQKQQQQEERNDEEERNKKKRTASTPLASATPNKSKRDSEFAATPSLDDQRRRLRHRRTILSSKSWKSLSMSRKTKLKNESNQTFRSPSIYDRDSSDIMKSYLSEQICPLTPSQKPTNVHHLVVKDETPPLKENIQLESTSKQDFSFTSNAMNMCSIM